MEGGDAGRPHPDTPQPGGAWLPCRDAQPCWGASARSSSQAASGALTQFPFSIRSARKRPIPYYRPSPSSSSSLSTYSYSRSRSRSYDSYSTSRSRSRTRSPPSRSRSPSRSPSYNSRSSSESVGF